MTNTAPIINLKNTSCSSGTNTNDNITTSNVIGITEKETSLNFFNRICKIISSQMNKGLKVRDKPVLCYKIIPFLSPQFYADTVIKKSSASEQKVLYFLFLRVLIR